MSVQLLAAPFPKLPPYDRWLLLTPPPEGAEVVLAARLREPAVLAAAISRLQENLQTHDTRAAASLWNKCYNASVASGALIGMTMAGIGLDSSAEQMSILFDERGLPAGGIIHLDGEMLTWSPRLQAPVPGRAVPAGSLLQLQTRVVTGLLAGHLAPAIRALSTVSGLAPSISWGNLANLIADLYEHMTDLPGPAAEDRQMLLDSPSLPGLTGANPMRGAVRYEEIEDRMIRIRKRCCLRYRIPGTLHCYTCPLLTNLERAALLPPPK